MEIKVGSMWKVKGTIFHHETIFTKGNKVEVELCLYKKNETYVIVSSDDEIFVFEKEMFLLNFERVNYECC